MGYIRKGTPQKEGTNIFQEKGISERAKDHPCLLMRDLSLDLPEEEFMLNFSCILATLFLSVFGL